MINVLVTAFGAFPGAPSNPTIAIVRELERRHGKRLARLSIALHTSVLPVRFSQAPEALSVALETTRPDVVLHLGLAARRHALSVEMRAINRIGTLRADAGRAVAASRAVMSGARDERASRWPAQRIRAAMDRSASTRLSIDAGDYVCNQTLFLTLSTSVGQVGFIHTPRLARCDTHRRPGLNRMVEAAVSALLVMAVEARRTPRELTLDRHGR